MSKRLRETALFVTALLLCGAVASDGEPGSARITQTAAINGIEMSFTTLGAGDPLLLLHAGTQSGEMWEPFVEPLAARYRLVIPDLRGHGSSTSHEGPLTTHRFAEDVVALMDHLQINRFRAIGASVGGMTLLRMAMEKPERIEALVVIGVGTDLPKECRAILARTSAGDLSETAWQSLRARHRHGDAQIRALAGATYHKPHNSSDLPKSRRWKS